MKAPFFMRLLLALALCWQSSAAFAHAIEQLTEPPCPMHAAGAVDACDCCGADCAPSDCAVTTFAQAPVASVDIDVSMPDADRTIAVVLRCAARAIPPLQRPPIA